ncbi:MAG: hypothetical protein A3J83_02270 [Elusimicrobia bacterium RIFOXYA2_FULL_40_6]|nr:MAG: hypothetical protein A3J83_02270 [Elusimicrobia bacterium RIFOXYA2_FULL_40_6]
MDNQNDKELFNYIRKSETVEPSFGFRKRLWDKINYAKIPVLKWLPVPLAFAAVIISFISFSVVSPLLYGIASADTNKQFTKMVKNTLFCPSAKNIIAPINFVSFCNEYCRILCEHCQKQKGSESSCGRCGK